MKMWQWNSINAQKRDFEIAQECNVSNTRRSTLAGQKWIFAERKGAPEEMSGLAMTALAARKHGMTYGHWMAMRRDRREAYESERLENKLLR